MELNRYELHEEHACIIVESAKFGTFKVMIDLEDVERCKLVRWCVGKIYHTESLFYVRGKYNGKVVLLHRYIMNVEGRTNVVDHINGDSLDNTKNNLRIGSQQQNTMNRKHENELTVSGYRGVLWFYYNNVNKWFSYIQINGKRISLGYHDKLEDAIKARKTAELKYFGEYARQ